MMRRALLLLPALLLSQPSFADPKPVPPEKSAYVGDWTAPNFQLSIQQDGKIHYNRKKEGSQFNLNIELQHFDGNNFEAGIPFLHTTFVVSQPPHLDNGKWKMTVDGVELTRSK